MRWKSIIAAMGLLLSFASHSPALADVNQVVSAKNVASIIRYLKDGKPLANSSAAGLVPNQLLMRQLGRNQINTIGLLEFDSQLRDLMFEGALGCAVTGAETVDCRTPLEFSRAVTKLFGEIRARASSDASIYAPHLEILEIEGGLLLVGELNITKSGRNSLSGSLMVFTHDYKNPSEGTPIGPIKLPMPFDRASGGETEAEDALIVELICRAAEQISQKIGETVQTSSCAA